MLAFSYGYTIIPLPAAQVHKHIREGNTGLNTGGMGAYAPVPVATPTIMERITREAPKPMIDGMQRGRLAHVISSSWYHSLTWIRLPIYWPPIHRLYLDGLRTKGPGFGDPETEHQDIVKKRFGFCRVLPGY